MDDRFNIYIDRLGVGESERIVETFDPTFLHVEEDDLSFHKPIAVEGEAQREGTTLILHLSVETYALMPCAICNEPVEVKIAIPDLYHTVEVEEVKGGKYNVQELLRESLLLEVPHTAECDGNCPERQELKKYLKRGS